MPFKTPKPVFDERLVLEIEDHLDQIALTEIEYQEEMGESSAPGLMIDHACGRGVKSYARPMFEVIYDEAFSGSRLPVTPCEACDDMARSWKCSEHHEISWDTEKRRWDRPIPARPEPARHPDGQPSGFDMIFESYASLERAFDGRAYFSSQTRDEERQRQHEAEQRIRYDRLQEGQWIFYHSPELAEAERQINEHIIDSLRYSRPEVHNATVTLHVQAETGEGHRSFQIEVQPNDDQSR